MRYDLSVLQFKKLGRYFIALLSIALLATVNFGCEGSNPEDADVSAASKTESNESSLASDTVDKGIGILKLKGAIRNRRKKAATGNNTATVLVYMNGSDLESDDGAASRDLTEMVKGCKSGNVNVLVQTMGTKKWTKKYGIASDRSQIYKVENDGLTLVNDSLGQLDCTKSKTLAEFIKWGVKNYPADRYFLQLWDHGGGAVYGFGYDQFVGDESTLSIAEMKTALSSAGVYFDFIGMDCCIMASLETCCALYNFCDYAILSEDFEPGDGWSYTGWLKELNSDPAINTRELAKTAVDDMIADLNAAGEGRGILTVFDESVMKVLFTTWRDFAYANETALLGNNYSRAVKAHGRVLPVFKKISTKLSDYYITDIMALAQTLNTKESKALSSAVNNSIVYTNCTEDTSHLTGLAVTLPYGDDDFYDELKLVFDGAGIDNEYVQWLGRFVDAQGVGNYYDYDDWDDSWDGWDSFLDDYDWSGWWHSNEDHDYWNDDRWGFDDYEDSEGWFNSDDDCDDYYDDDCDDYSDDDCDDYSDDDCDDYYDDDYYDDDYDDDYDYEDSGGWFNSNDDYVNYYDDNDRDEDDYRGSKK